MSLDRPCWLTLSNVGTDNSGPDSDLTGFILKAGSKESSFSNWALANTPDTQGLLVTGTRVRAGLLFVCVNPSNQVWALKLTDKSVVAKMALPVSAFCNDLGFDTSGQLFVTTNGNAGKPDILYKLAANLVPTTSASSTVASTAWKTWHTAPVGEGGLNGLVFSSTLGKLLWSQGASIRSSATTGDTATASTEVNLPTTWNVDGMQLTAAGNLLVIVGESSATTVTNLGAQKINLSTGTKGATSAVAGGANCSTTVAIVGDDAFCTTGNDSNNQAIQKVLRLTGAGKL